MNQCPACRVSVLPGAVFCTACGFRFQNVAAPAPPPMAIGPLPAGARRICSGCGAVAPMERHDCILCQTPFGAMPLVVPARPDGTYFALIIECDFQCRACGLKSPLDSLDTDGEVECRRCGLSQAFDVEQWEEALGFAQDVADLSGPITNAKGGQRGSRVKGNPYESIGVKNTSAERQLSGMVIGAEGMKTRSMRIKATSGHPPCKACRAPLDVQLDGRGNAQTFCARCNERAVYALPVNASTLLPNVRAVIAEDHRTDRPPVRMQVSPGGGAVAISCPQCGASLPATENTSFVTCPYCRTAARIPTKALFKMGGSQPAPQPWWVLFHGPSPTRIELGESADDDDEDSAKRARGAIPAVRVDRREARAHRDAQRNSGIAGVIAALCTAGIGVGIYYYQHEKRKEIDAEVQEAQKKADKSAKSLDDDDDDGRGTSSKAGPVKASTGKVVVPRDQFHDLTGCGCKMGSSDSKLAVHLDLESTGMVVGQDDGFVTAFDLSWLIDVPGQDPFRLEAKNATAPPKKVKGRALSLGTACDGKTTLYVAGRNATAWSLDGRTVKWTATLPKEYSASIPPPKKGLDIDCATLSVTNGVVRIPVAGGTFSALKLSDGTPAK